MSYLGKLNILDATGKFHINLFPTAAAPKSAYDVYVEVAEANQETPLSEEMWLESLRGVDGDDASVTKQNVENVLTGEISSHSHATGGMTQSQILTRQL